MTTKLERLQDCPIGGRLIGRTELPDILGCSQRKADYLLESGRLASFLFGKQRKTTEAAVAALTREFIEAELERLEELANGEQAPPPPSLRDEIARKRQHRPRRLYADSEA